MTTTLPTSTAAATPTAGPVRRAGRWIDHWDPEDAGFWAGGGRAVARRNLGWSVLAEFLGFCVWALWSVVVPQLPAAGFALTLPGIAGLIVGVGITADSFIVYFERVRDELREGRNLRAAVEAGWHRAKRTILVADGVNIIAAVVLYVLASSGVRGFAFTLGLTTLIDLAVFWFFTHPMLTLLARNRFFASGHPWSGFDVDRLRAGGMRYTGRGRIEAQEPVEPEGSRRTNPGVRSDEGAVL